MKALPYLIVLWLLTGCAAIKDKILVTTNTGLAFSVAENPTTGLYEAKLGYVRSELALVPTNGVNIITEIRWNGIFKTGGLYQRMAIGDKAVQAAIPMFLKNPDGTLHPDALKFIRPPTN